MIYSLFFFIVYFLIFNFMANLDANFENFVAHVGKHGFDVGKDNFFTAAPGMILPVWKDILNAGERLHIRISDIVRTNPMMKPASLHIRQKVDVFFVPASLVYTAFGQTLFQTNDVISSLYSYSDEQSENQFIDNAGYLPSCRMISYTSSSDFNTLPMGSFFESKGKSEFRLAMMLGYNPFALISDLSYVDDGDTYYVSPFNNNPSVFPWAAATYQAIYHNWYRNDDWETRNVKKYNLDWLLYGSDIPTSSFLELHYHQRIGDYFSSIKRSPVMSTINLSNTGYSDTEDSSKVLSQVNSYLSTEFDNLVPINTVGTRDLATSDKDFATVTPSSGSAPYTPASIRTLFAVEKYLRITGRAAKNYDSQVLAHFGFNVPRDIKHEISYLGGFDGYLDSKQIISTAGTSFTELGEQAGYGEGQLGGNVIKFTAPCHGFVMAVFYVVPEFSYPQGMIFDKLNAISNRLDFFFPEYDKLGKQPMFAYECFPVADPTDTRDYKNIDVSNYIGYGNRNQIVGWQYRYEHFKRQYNVHSLAFYRPYTDYSTDNDWASWIIGKNPFDIYSVGESSVDIDYRSLLVTPYDLDRIFVQQYKGTCDVSDLESPWLIFQTDPIMVAMKVDAKKTSAMSPTGEPDLF